MKCFLTVVKKPLQSKVLLAMKLTVALILFFTLNVSANGFGQDKISLKVKKAEIAGILSTIEKQTNYRFLYNNNLEDIREKVSLTVKDANLDEVMDLLLQKTRLLYQIMGNNLVVIKEDPNAPIRVPDVVIRGKVTGEGGAPVAGASVQVKGSTTGTTTDNDGNFTLTVANANATLVITSVGYDMMEIPLAGRTEVSIALVTSAKMIDQVVVIGYGTASKRDLTGSITKVAGKDVADKPNTNPIASLQSKVAGLSVVNNATPGQAPDIRIRGTISIGSYSPLYVVDGIFNDNIDYLNPNDIESIEILKDPSSLAIFGVRGAPGVIAITTKKAKTGQVVVNLNSTVGTKKMVDPIKMANADEFKMLLAEEGQNRFNETGSTVINDFIATNLDKWPGNTDWVEALTRTAFFNTNNISVSASTEKNRFYMSFGYNTDEGLVKHVKYDRLQLTVNDEFKLSKNIKIGFNIIGSREKFPYGGAVGQLGQAKRVAPIVPSGTISTFARNPYGKDSAFYDLYYAVPVIQNTLNNPLNELENNWDKVTDIKYRTVGSVFAEVTFLRNFTARATVYADISDKDKREYRPIYTAFNPEVVGDYKVIVLNPLTSVRQDEERSRRFQQDYILTYKKNFGEHGLTATAGFTTYYSAQYKTAAEAKQKSGGDPIPDDERFWYINNGFTTGPTALTPDIPQKEAATVSGLARVLYNFKSKYFLNASFRRDGSSLIYNPDTRSQNFWAVGAAWELTKENFMQSQTIFDFLKLKGSIGVLGNQNTYGTDYPYFPGLSQGNTAVFGNSVFPSYSNNYLVSKDLKWETVHAREIGIEFNAMKNRLHGEFAYYNKETKDMLAYLRPLGVLPTLGNFGGVLNKGIELTLSWDQKLARDLSFTASVNVTTYKNEVTQLDYPLPADEQFPNQTQVGYPIAYFYGYVVEGVFQSYADKLASPVFTEFAYGPGDFKYKDLNNDGVVNADDKTMIGNPTPDFTYGGSLNIVYKNFNLGIDVGGVSGNEIYRYWNTSENIFSVYNYPQYAVNRWHGPGTSNWVPILDQTHKVNRVASTFGIEDGSYFRIRNLQLGYNFSTAMLSKIFIKSARVFVNVQNLKTWRNNLGYSPEFGGGFINGQPATSFGIDLGEANSTIPVVFTFGVNVNF